LDLTFFFFGFSEKCDPLIEKFDKEGKEVVEGFQAAFQAVEKYVEVNGESFSGQLFSAAEIYGSYLKSLQTTKEKLLTQKRTFEDDLVKEGAKRKAALELLLSKIASSKDISILQEMQRDAQKEITELEKCEHLNFFFLLL
jgi:hypothetical protein